VPRGALVARRASDVTTSRPCDLTYLRLRATLEKRRQLVGGNDLLIAAQALTLGYTIVTDDDREFSRINQLRLENWLHPS
jgi:tRNA(fMet)-specific endonuclease VapC